MAKQFNTRIQHKIDTYENWTKAENFIPLLGEIIIYTTNGKGEAETKIKIGDGTTKVNDLDFAVAGLASGEIDINTAQSDWAQVDNSQLNYIKNKPGDEIVSETSHLLTELIIETRGDASIVPGGYVWSENSEQDKDYQSGDKILLTILPDNVKLESVLYTDESTDNVLGLHSSQTGHFATFNLTSNNLLEAYANGFVKNDENIPYGLGINIIRQENFNSPYLLYLISADDNLENKIVILDVIRSNKNYIKLSNNALNIDNEPVENSENLITSGAIYNSLSNFPKIQLITWEEND